MKSEWRSSVACIGTFDGVHLGHQAVIREAVRTAHAGELPCILVTFDRHPASVLSPLKCPKSIASLQNNLLMFQSLGVAATIVLHFDAELSRMSAERFLREILLGAVRATRVVVGHDFAMGNGREGTPDWLSARLPTYVLPPFEIEGLRVSSSAIRRLIESGEMSEAAKLLGRPFSIDGIVVGGEKLGRQLGYPTANLARSFDQVIPPNGIYAGRMKTPYGSFLAATSIGTRPAVGGVEKTIESYLLDYPGGSLYGSSVELQLEQRLRDELNFPSLTDLTDQIASDVNEVRARLHSAT